MGDVFEAVFVWLFPFVCIEGFHSVRDGYLTNRYLGDGDDTSPESRSKSESRTEDPSESFDAALRHVLEISAEVGSLDYPNVKLNQFVPVSWKSVAEDCALISPEIPQIALGLQASIGAVSANAHAKMLARKIMSYCERSGNFPPFEGQFQESMLPAFRRLFERRRAEDWWFQPEFEGGLVTEIHGSKKEIERLMGETGSLYSSDRQILLTWHWDSHFALVCGSHEELKNWVSELGVEGFFAKQSTTHEWWRHTSSSH